MTALARIRVTIGGGTGLPGLLTHYIRGTIVAGDITALGTFYSQVQLLAPNGVTFSVPNTGDVLEDTTGALTGGWTVGSPVVRTGSGGTNYAAGTGCAVTWDTGAIVNGRRLRGRSYICPMGSGFYDTDGTLTGTVATTLNAAASALIASSPLLAVWHRKNSKGPGSSSPIVAGTVKDVVRSLRSRRS